MSEGGRAPGQPGNEHAGFVAAVGQTRSVGCGSAQGAEGAVWRGETAESDGCGAESVLCAVCRVEEKYMEAFEGGVPGAQTVAVES